MSAAAGPCQARHQQLTIHEHETHVISDGVFSFDKRWGMIFGVGCIDFLLFK